MTVKFNQDELQKLWKPMEDSSGEDNGLITIIGGSGLFHGAPVLAIKSASRLVDMVFFTSPEKTLERLANRVKASLNSFIWVPWGEVEEYIKKSEAVLIGPGFLRFHREGSKEQGTDNKVLDQAGTETKRITQYLLHKYPLKKWVVDGGSLQVMGTAWIPNKAILTPNIKEYELLFNEQFTMDNLQLNARKFNCVIIHKGPVAYVTDGQMTYEVGGGNAGLTKGGTGDVLAGVTVGLAAKNPPLLAAAAASYVVKETAEELYEKVGYNFNADDVAEKIFEVMKRLGD